MTQVIEVFRMAHVIKPWVAQVLIDGRTYTSGRHWTQRGARLCLIRQRRLTL